MHAAPFEYLTPSHLEEVTELLARHGDDAKVLAGGQSLVPMMNLRLLAPAVVIDINGIDFGTPRVDKGVLVLPALTRQAFVQHDPLVVQACPLLADAVAFVGNRRVRARGTVGGNLAHGDPSSELGCAAIALGAEVTAMSPRGSRTIPAGDLFVSYLTTSLEPDELITEVRFPTTGSRTGWSFLELARRAGEFAIVNAAATVTLGRDGSCTAASVVLGGVADRLVDTSAAAQDFIVGRRPDSAVFAEVAERVTQDLRPPSDIHASGAYRQRIVGVYVRRALAAAVERGRSKIN